MKRTSGSLDPQNSREKLPRRQEPVSCFWCRKKKLKCDRAYPCSNCRARKLACSSSSDPGEAYTGIDAANPSSSSQQIDELKSRLRKLEHLLTEKTGSELVSPSTTLKPVPVPASPDTELENTVTWIETDAFEHEASPPNGSLTSKLKIAENFGSFIFALTRPRIPTSLDMQNVVATLPSRSQGAVMLEFFFDEILWIYHIIHIPTVRRHFDKLYIDIENNQQPEYGPLALISTLYALTAYFSSEASNLSFKHSDSMIYCQKWTLLAQDALSAANCLANPSVETLQSLIYIAQHLMPNIGAIATLRTLSSTITHTARALGLHQLDSEANRKLRENTQVDWVDIESKRRIWWHICSTDWIMSFMSGSQSGTYSISPKQMTVNYPSNCDDSSINSRGDYDLPLDQPTEMTYFIYRCTGSIVFRGIVDAAWDCGCAGVEELPFELVLEFDAKLNKLVKEVDAKYEKIMSQFPSYFDLQNQQHSGTNAKMVLFSRQIAMAHFGAHTRFSRLHRPFLVRGAHEPRYAYSRMVCLRSARKVIELGRSMMEDNKRVDAIKIWSVNHHVFVSLTILVMDYCFNREEPRAKERKEEILECFRLLEAGEQRRESTIATRGLQKLKDILRDGKRKRSPDMEQPKNPSPPRNYPSSTHDMHYPQERANIGAPMSNIYSGDAFGQPSLVPQYQWTDFDYSSLDNINFDVDLDPNQFDALFQNIEGNKMF
ncbi:transcription factor [Hyphodiscus hymeniophilus]|uniref:Transcription factor n=1 Tax=Hyphodiscus hymeniophilus TaxID=353542 RepID=A0A9P6SMY9_9HELO|nr:transcription factor [Hyphodiscus hymeniophilus]